MRTSISIAIVGLGTYANATTTSASVVSPANTLLPKTISASNSTSTGTSSAFSEDDFAKAVTALGKADAASKGKDFVNSLKDADISSRQEAAMFLAQVWHESTGLKDKEEIACKESEATKVKCDSSYPLTPGKGVKGKHYYGRGYIQLTWDYNYEKASLALFGDGSKLLNDPDSVATSEELSWRTAAWYWKANVHNAAGVKEGKFGASTKAINGALECSSPQGEALTKAKKRFEFYSTIMKAIGDSSKLDESGCYN